MEDELARLREQVAALQEEVRRLRAQVAGHCQRIADQSELLSKRAERT